MGERVSVEVVSTDGLIRWEWCFWFDRYALWLDSYTEATRDSRKKKFTTSQNYSRLNLRQSSLTEADVVLPSTVRDEAIKQFCEGLTVKRWSERKG